MRLLAALLFLIAMPPIGAPGVRAAGDALAVVVASSLPLSDISTSMLRRAFSGEIAEYAGGKRLIPINLPPNTPPRVQFDQAVLGLAPDAMARFWVDRRIRDQPGAPKAVPSPELALRLASSLQGAIAYVPATMLNASVKALTIDGKRHGEAGYLLQ